MPFFWGLTTSPQVSEQLGKRHKTVARWAQQRISLVRSFLPERPIKLMGDTAYRVLELGLHAKPQRVTDASPLVEGMPCSMSPRKTRTRHTIGPPRVGGLRLPALDQVFQNPETGWQKRTLDCYGQGERTLEMCTGTALW